MEARSSVVLDKISAIPQEKDQGRSGIITTKAITVSDKKSATSAPAKKRGRPQEIKMEARSSVVLDKKSATPVPENEQRRPRNIPTESITFATMTAGTTIDVPPTATKAEEPRKKRGRPKKVLFPTSSSIEQTLLPTNKKNISRRRSGQDHIKRATFLPDYHLSILVSRGPDSESFRKPSKRVRGTPEGSPLVKYTISADTSAQAKKRGRPRKVLTGAGSVSEKKSATFVPAKKRGRPQKIIIEASSVFDKNSVVPVPAKQQGGSRNISTETITVAATNVPNTSKSTESEEPRKKRGRPKKVLFPTSSTNEQGLLPTNETNAKRARTTKDVDDKAKHKGRPSMWENCGNCLACWRTEDCGKCSPCCAGFDCLLRQCCIPTLVGPVKAKTRPVPAGNVISNRKTYGAITRDMLDDAVSLSSNGSFGMADMSDLEEENDDIFRRTRAPEILFTEKNFFASANNAHIENNKPTPEFAVNEPKGIAHVQVVDSVTASIFQQGVSITTPPMQDSLAPIKAVNPKDRVTLSAAELARTIRQKQRLAAEETDDDESDEDDMMGMEM